MYKEWNPYLDPKNIVMKPEAITALQYISQNFCPSNEIIVLEFCVSVETFDQSKQKIRHRENVISIAFDRREKLPTQYIGNFGGVDVCTATRQFEHQVTQTLGYRDREFTIEG